MSAADPQFAAIADNLAFVRGRIAKAARAAGRDPAGVQLVAVSKTQPAAAVEAAIRAGQSLFGENRVQEAKEKFPALRARHPQIELRLIGPLQTNKAREAVQLFDVIESVDRERLARELAKEMAKLDRRPRLYIQVNTGEEPQKAGVPPLEADSFIRLCREELGLAVEGLMCIPPADDEPGPHFALLAKIAARNGLARLSMGMSGDYEIGVQFGATSVRVGTAIFGQRATSPETTGDAGASAGKA